MKPLVLLKPRKKPLPPPLPVTRDDVPVLLLHGYTGSPGAFAPIAHALQERGRPALGLEFGQRGTARCETSLAEIAGFVRDLPCEKLDVVGHSQGGMHALSLAWLPEFHGRIRRVVGLGSTFRGLRLRYPKFLNPLVAGVCGDMIPQLRNWGYLEATVPAGVEVVSIVSTSDRIVPATSARLGRVVEVNGVSHTGMTKLVGPVLEALD